jgi:hypothetical protein
VVKDFYCCLPLHSVLIFLSTAHHPARKA